MPDEPLGRVATPSANSRFGRLRLAVQAVRIFRAIQKNGEWWRCSQWAVSRLEDFAYANATNVADVAVYIYAR